MPRIEAIALYELVGTRDRVVAPNAHAGIRPAEAREDLLVIMTEDGRQGITNWSNLRSTGAQTDVSWLAGLDPRRLFDWTDSRVAGWSAEYSRDLRRTPGVDIALLDLCAQIEGVPLWRLLGDEVRDAVPAYDSTLYFEDLVDRDSNVACVVDRAHEAVARGHRALKIRVGRGLKWMPWPECTERDVEVCRAVRASVGRDIRLMVDGDGGYAKYVEDAADFLSETADCKFEFAEDMVADHEAHQLRQALLAIGLKVPLAGGADAEGPEWLEAQWPGCRYDLVQMDMCRMGLFAYRDVAVFARDRGVRIAPHNFGTWIGVAASLQLGKVVNEYMYCECDDSRFDDYAAPGYKLLDGQYRLPDAPGLGVIVHDPRSEPA